MQLFKLDFERDEINFVNFVCFYLVLTNERTGN